MAGSLNKYAARRLRDLDEEGGIREAENVGTGKSAFGPNGMYGPDAGLDQDEKLRRLRIRLQALHDADEGYGN